MNIKFMHNGAGVIAALVAVAVLPAGVASAAGGPGEPHNAICGARSGGFAGLYCLWDDPRDGRAVEGSNRTVEREPASR